MVRSSLRQPLSFALALGSLFSLTVEAQQITEPEPSGFLKFHAWQNLDDEQKPALYLGLINGLFAEPRSEKFSALALCIEKNIAQGQGVKMVDKYLKDNPQRWNTAIPIGIVEALTVKDGPCPGKNPWK